MANERPDTGRTATHERERTQAGRGADQNRDPGAFIGRMPERATEAIPGGVGRKDRRVSAVASQPGTASPEAAPTPEGHREGGDASDDTIREAGQDR
jgi:hypothetical protein